MKKYTVLSLVSILSLILLGSNANSVSAYDSTTLTGACGDFSTPGSYILNSDITVGSNVITDCFIFHDTSNVDIDCQNHTINVNKNPDSLYPSPRVFAFNNINNYTFKNCIIRLPSVTSYITANYFTIDNSTNGTISQNSFKTLRNSDVMSILIDHSSNITFSNNIVDGSVSFNHSSNNLIQNNVMTSKATIENDAGSIIVSFGKNNKVLNNKISGNSNPIFLKTLDDGIVINNEDSDLIQNNIITGVYDCGIETSGLITNTIIDNNTISNSTLCGIGGWYWNSMSGNTFSNNKVDRSHFLFWFYRLYGLKPDETVVYFKDNTFKNNVLTNRLVNSGISPQSVSYFDFIFANTMGNGSIPQNTLVAGNNHFLNNNFGVSGGGTIFRPANIYIDDGGNICPPGSEVLKCDSLATPPSPPPPVLTVPIVPLFAPAQSPPASPEPPIFAPAQSPPASPEPPILPPAPSQITIHIIYLVVFIIVILLMIIIINKYTKTNSR